MFASICIYFVRDAVRCRFSSALRVRRARAATLPIQRLPSTGSAAMWIEGEEEAEDGLQSEIIGIMTAIIRTFVESK